MTVAQAIAIMIALLVIIVGGALIGASLTRNQPVPVIVVHPSPSPAAGS